MSTLKAYLLSSDHAECSMLVYSDTRDHARAMGVGSDELCDLEYIEIRARREKHADQWADDKGHPYTESDADRFRDLGWWTGDASYCESCSLYDWADGNKPEWAICRLCFQCGECGHADGCLWALIETIVGEGDPLIFETDDLADHYSYHWQSHPRKQAS